MREPPPIPVMPMSRPIPNPKMTITGSIYEVSLPFLALSNQFGREPAREGSNRLFPRFSGENGVTSALHPGVGVLDQAPHRLGKVIAADIRQGHLLQDGAQVRADRDPDVAQTLGRAGILGVLGGPVLHVREWTLDRANDVGDGDVVRRAGEPVAPPCAALGPHHAGVLEIEQDVLQELERNALRLREVLALDGLAVRGGGQLEGGAHGVVGLCGDPHFVTMLRFMIDLQAHSTVSDGQLPPREVATAAAEAVVTVMSLTDHDAVAGVADAVAAATDAGIECVPAVEMSCVHRYSDDLHMLGYWVDLDAIAPACERAQQERVDRAKEIIERLNSFGVEVRFEDAVAQASAADSIGRPHIARAAGAGPDLGPFFEEYLVPGAKAFIARRWPRAEEAVALIHAAGGVAVVAHPYWDVSQPPQVRDLVESLVRDVGLDGIETFYPPHTKAQTAHCLELCEEFDLTPTGSSDFHGPTHKTFSRFGAYDTYGLGEPAVPARPDT